MRSLFPPVLVLIKQIKLQIFIVGPQKIPEKNTKYTKKISRLASLTGSLSFLFLPYFGGNDSAMLMLVKHMDVVFDSTKENCFPRIFTFSHRFFQNGIFKPQKRDFWPIRVKWYQS